MEKEEELGPLHRAARNGSVTALRDALKRFDVSTRDLWGQTALHWAETVETAQVLVAAGAKIGWKDPTGDTPLHWAAEHGNIKVTDYLIAQGGNVNEINHRQETPLHAAAACGQWDVVRTLLEHNADAKVANASGETAMHIAARTGDLNTVKALVKAGAKVRVVSKDGATPLHEACKHSISLQMVKYLIQRGADVNTATNNGWTALMLSLKRKSQQAIEELVDKGADVTCLSQMAAVRGNGWTVLHLGAEVGSLKLCQAIVKKGAGFYDAEARTANGDRPVDVAKTSVYGSEKVVKFLEEQVKIKKMVGGGKDAPTTRTKPGATGTGHRTNHGF
mmetsp:Transcript_32360/g.50405  ORF Transcript_32360/g.50405 Transcript_32360/m.50405 type:complete len:334 (-) Transcript_32360:1069-2070(-)